MAQKSRSATELKAGKPKAGCRLPLCSQWPPESLGISQFVGIPAFNCIPGTPDDFDGTKDVSGWQVSGVNFRFGPRLGIGCRLHRGVEVDAFSNVRGARAEFLSFHTTQDEFRIRLPNADGATDSAACGGLSRFGVHRIWSNT